MLKQKDSDVQNSALSFLITFKDIYIAIGLVPIYTITY